MLIESTLPVRKLILTNPDTLPTILKVRLQKPSIYLERNAQFNNLLKKKLILKFQENSEIFKRFY